MLVRLATIALLVFLPLLVLTQSITRQHFPVTDGGATLAYPFAGGLDAPQMSSVDLNFDGTKDIFIFDRAGYVMIPLVGDPNAPGSYALDWTVIEDFPDGVPLWALLKDFNGDDIPDMFASTLHPGVQGIDVYRGSNTNGRLSFERMTFDLGSFDLLYIEVGGKFTPMYSAWNDIPTIEDIDNDGDLDVLTFEPGGALMSYYQNLSLERGAGLDTFSFDWADFCWGKFRENDFNAEVTLSDDPNKCADVFNLNLNTRHSGSASLAYDMDGDGDKDLLLGDLGSAGITKLLNGGDSSHAFITEQELDFPKESIPVDLPLFVAPFMLDINGDGLDDFVAASNNDNFSENVDVVWYYQNSGTQSEPKFDFIQSDLFVDQMLDFGSESRVAIGDLTGDGLEDILIGTGGYYDEGLRDPRLVLLENTGTSSEPIFTVADEDYLNFSRFGSLPTWSFSPDLGDLDGDGDMDLIVGESTGALFYLENISESPNAVEFATPVYPYMSIDVGSASVPRIVDLNQDGLGDLVIGERLGNNDTDGKCSNLTYFENQGSQGTPMFDADDSAFPNTQCLGEILFNGQIGAAEYSAPEFVTVDDGSMRAIIGSANGELLLYDDIEDNIYGVFNRIDSAYGSIKEGFRTVPAMSDLDDDGYFDLVVGNMRGGISIYSTDMKRLSTNTSETDYEQSLSVYPTLADNQITVEGLNGQTFEAAMYDASGRQMSIQTDEDQIQFDVPAGIYIVVVKVLDQQESFKIVVQ